MDKEYPKPNHKGWEEEYRYAKAFEVVSSDIVKYLFNLQSQHEALLEKEKQDEPDIETA